MPSDSKMPPADAPRPRPGKPEYKPSERDRALVKVMISGGIPQDRIAAGIGVDAKTLRKHFRKEIDSASALADAQVVASLFNMATKGGNVAAAIWWTKARMRWSERVIIADASQADFDLASLSDAEIAERIERLRRDPAVVRAAKADRIVH